MGMVQSAKVTLQIANCARGEIVCYLEEQKILRQIGEMLFWLLLRTLSAVYDCSISCQPLLKLPKRLDFKPTQITRQGDVPCAVNNSSQIPSVIHVHGQ